MDEEERMQNGKSLTTVKSNLPIHFFMLIQCPLDEYTLCLK